MSRERTNDRDTSTLGPAEGEGRGAVFYDRVVK